MPLAAATRLGPYEIISAIGAGGMGEVYRAKDLRLNREVAIKVLPAALSNDTDRLRRFEQEAQAAGALNHPNILAVYDVGTHDGMFYLVSELLEGETLRKRLAESPIPPRKAIDYAMQIARGLAAAHAKGIVHRDLKPENLFVTKDGQIKILDFGLAKMSSAKAVEATGVATEAMGTQSGVVMGTVGYMSPEQVRGHVADGRADIFSLGVILYEMLSGKRAFHGESSVETMNSILKDDPPELPVTLPPALDRIIRRSIEKKPEERFQSVQDVAFALETISGTTERQPPVKHTAVGAHRIVRYIIVAAIACALVVAGVFLGRRTSRTSPPSFQRLTFRRGTILSAKFAPEGRTVIYGAAWERQPVELFSTRPDSPESRPLGVAAANISGISTTGEMAILINSRFQGFLTEAGTLARVPLAGGAPREILEDVKFADWISDGLAIVRSMGGRNRVEFPIGKVLYETLDRIGDLRISPKGDLLAIAEHPSGWGTNWSVAVLDRKGNKRTLCTTGYSDDIYLAWSGGDEIWYSHSNGMGGGDSIHAVTLAGNERVVTRVPTLLRLFDISHDGTVLVSRVNWRVGIIGLSPGEQKERDFSWQDASEVEDLSADGKTILTTEFGEGGGGRWAVYLRKTDGSPAVRIGDGAAFTLSPDGKWALAMRPTSPPQLVVLPTGPGEARVLKNEGFKDYSWADWLPDGQRIVFVGIEPGHAARCYLQHLEGGKPRPITPEGAVMAPSEKAISPDGRALIATSPDQRISLYPIEGGPPRVVTALGSGDILIRWSQDGRSIYVFQQRGLPVRIERVDLTTGRRQLWREIMPPDPDGILMLYALHLTPDGNSPFYSYIRNLSDLYLVKGLR
jgi:eukaryotic-like serine/threonine-protein kinase